MDPEKVKKKLISDLNADIPEFDKEDFSLKRLQSKKNQVYELTFKVKPKRFPKTLIIKLFRTEFAEKEHNALKKLKKQTLSVPKVLFFKKPYIFLEKLKGANLCDFINDPLKKVHTLTNLDQKTHTKIINSVKKLAGWLAKLHKKNIIDDKDPFHIIVFNKGDTRLRDFIYNNSRKLIYGMDFEESYEGHYLDDIAWICCSLIDTDPGIFQITEPIHKIELINIFLKEYYRINDNFQFSFDYFAERLIENLNTVIKRRSIKYGPINKDSILKSILKDY